MSNGTLTVTTPLSVNSHHPMTLQSSTCYSNSLSNKEVKGVYIEFNTSESEAPKNVTLVSVNSRGYLKICQRTKKVSGMVRKGRTLPSHFKGENDVVYCTVFTTALIHILFSTKIRLKNKSVESCRDIVEYINNKYFLKCDAKITRTTLRRYNNNNWKKAIRIDFDSKLSKVLSKAITLHVGMKQILGSGEAKSKDMIALMSTVVQNIKHKNSINISYTYDRLKINKAERLQNSDARELDYIKYQ